MIHVSTKRQHKTRPAMLALFVFYSVPALDKKLMESKTDYEKYKKSVWGLIPIKKRRADRSS